LFPVVLLDGVAVFILRRRGNSGDVFNFGKARTRIFDGNRPRTMFDDVAGVDEAKQELQEVVDFLKTPSTSSALFGLGHLGSDMTAENALFVFLYTFVGGSMYGLAYLRTGSLHAAILAHIIANTAASLSIAVPHEAMSWVDLGLVELCCLACCVFRRMCPAFTQPVCRSCSPRLAAFVWP
jgi:hypothetical protein